MITFLRAIFLIGLVWVLSPIILTCYVAILLDLILISLIGGNGVKKAVEAWAMVVNVDLELYLLAMKYGLVETIKTYQEIKKES